MIDSNLMSEIQDAAAQGKDTLAPEANMVRDGKNPLEALCIAMAHESIKTMSIFGRSISLDPLSVLRSLQEQGFDIVERKP